MSFGTRNRLTPSSIVLPSRVRTATTSASLKCASGTNNLVPDRTNPPAVSRAARHDAGRVPARIGLGPGEAHLGIARRDARQPFLPLRRRAGFKDRRSAEQHGGKERAWHDRAAHLLHQHGHVDEAETAAARFLRVENAEPSLLGELPPKVFGYCCRLRHTLTHKGGGAFVFEKPPSAGPQQLLLFGKADIHPTRRACNGGNRTAPCRGNAAAAAASTACPRPCAIRASSAPRARLKW